MTETEVTTRLQRAQEAIQRELQRLAEDLPAFEVSLHVDWINASSFDRRRLIPTVRVSASLEAP